MCDLVLAHVPGFANGKGLDLHIRSKRMRAQYSYVERAVLRIGEDTLEVLGGPGNPFWINGLKGKPSVHGILKDSIGGYPIKFKRMSKDLRRFEIALENGDKVIFKVYKDLVRAQLHAHDAENFGTAIGLMGQWPSGKKMNREGTTELTDYDEFGQEWQVIAMEPQLFHEVDGQVPQAPQKCEMPSATATKRRLAESTITLEEAQIACARVAVDERDMCVFDVLAMEDKGVGGAY